MRQEILTGALKPIHKQAGLYLEELGDQIMVLKYKEKRIAFFNQTSVKVEEIHKAADTYLKETDFFSEMHEAWDYLQELNYAKS
jgi:hypothetical protein